MEFKDRLKELRLSQGLTQKQLAEQAGFNMSIVNKWGNGKFVPGMQALIVLSKFFNESVGYIMGVED